MAMEFKVSPKKWAELGLPVGDLDTILNQGFKIVWAGSSITIREYDENGDVVYDWGLAKIVKAKLGFVDATFKAKYKELTGHNMVWSHEPELQQVINGAFSGGTLTPKAPAAPVKNAQPMSAKLAHAIKAGDLCNGTSSGSKYIVYLVSDEANIAFKRDGSSLSIRAEKMSDRAKKMLQAWGLNLKGDYASAHVTVADPSHVLRTLGSVSAMVITDPPKSILHPDAIYKVS